MENYLEAIYELSVEGMGARVSDIAKQLGVTKASTNSAIKTLADKGLITNEKYGEVFLTDAGRQMAETTSRKHHIIRGFFIDVLKIDAECADRDACAIEHVISTDAVQAMLRHLNKKL
jgi:Mn-dependent DtxR family transcriptional regulator